MPKKTLAGCFTNISLFQLTNAESNAAQPLRNQPILHERWWVWTKKRTQLETLPGIITTAGFHKKQGTLDPPLAPPPPRCSSYSSTIIQPPHSTTLVDGFNKNTPRTQPLGFYHWNHPSASIAQDRPAWHKLMGSYRAWTPPDIGDHISRLAFQSSQVQNFVLINRKHAFLKKRCASTSSVEDQFCAGFVQENNSKIGRLVVAPLQNYLGQSFGELPKLPLWLQKKLTLSTGADIQL